MYIGLPCHRTVHRRKKKERETLTSANKLKNKEKSPFCSPTFFMISTMLHAKEKKSATHHMKLKKKENQSTRKKGRKDKAHVV